MLEGFEEITILVVLALWTLPWKGVALWRSVQRGEKKWFIALLIVNTLGILEILYIFLFSKRKKRKGQGSSPLYEAQKAKQRKKEEAKRKILAILQKRGRIVNNDVEALLGVSDATATRYLEELENEDKIVQKGERGSKVFYTEISPEKRLRHLGASQNNGSNGTI